MRETELAGLLSQHVCKIKEVSTSKPGKHGHAKKAVSARCVITDKTINEIYTSHSGLYGEISPLRQAWQRLAVRHC